MDGFNSLLADKNALTLLYDDKLYLIKDKQREILPPEAVDGTSSNAVTSLAAQHIGIIFIYRSDEELDQSEQQLFADMVTKGLKLALDDVFLIRLPLADFLTLNELKEKYRATKIILWGLSASDLGLSQLIPKYKVTQVQEGCKLLAADSLEKISRDLSIKKQLWVSLQEMFK